MTSISKEDQRAKMEFIGAFFDDFDDKVAYLSELYKSGHRDEARILCSCYLEGLSLALCWPDERTKFSYVKVLKEHCGKSIFSYIHPKMLDEALNNLSERSNKWRAIHGRISDTLRAADRKLYEEREIADLLAPLMKASDIQTVDRELWRGSFAAIVYDRFRIAAVHGFGPPDGTTFDGTSFQGKPVPPIDFAMIYDCLKRVVVVSKELSKQSGKWFGHDYE